MCFFLLVDDVAILVRFLRMGAIWNDHADFVAFLVYISGWVTCYFFSIPGLICADLPHYCLSLGPLFVFFSTPFVSEDAHLCRGEVCKAPNVDCYSGAYHGR